MTREETLQHYKINAAGIITTPGKFEGEAVYMPHVYEVFMDGCADDDGNNILVAITDEDRSEFPELEDRETVYFTVRDDGFVCEVEPPDPDEEEELTPGQLLECREYPVYRPQPSPAGEFVIPLDKTKN